MPSPPFGTDPAPTQHRPNGFKKCNRLVRIDIGRIVLEVCCCNGAIGCDRVRFGCGIYEHAGYVKLVRSEAKQCESSVEIESSHKPVNFVKREFGENGIVRKFFVEGN